MAEIQQQLSNTNSHVTSLDKMVGALAFLEKNTRGQPGLESYQISINKDGILGALKARKEKEAIKANKHVTAWKIRFLGKFLQPPMISKKRGTCNPAQGERVFKDLTSLALTANHGKPISFTLNISTIPQTLIKALPFSLNISFLPSPLKDQKTTIPFTLNILALLTVCPSLLPTPHITIHLPKHFPYDSIKAVPWNYGPTVEENGVITELRTEIISAHVTQGQGITRSERIYARSTPVDIRGVQRSGLVRFSLKIGGPCRFCI
ncbi:uncharacterized protein G2W53_014214 [Senna tora]|uniref:Uncharacterized protein n=1 Tax=Senna tora TaxID=362788 RepID=A0A835C298_9FABA|nr:uncharacterized protein G2W53_014214 [Senna tora]